MKKLLFTTLLLAATVISAQREIDSLTYEQTQDITHFKEIKNRTQVKKYITINKNVIKIGDTVSLGIMNSLNGDDPSMASNTLKNSRAVVSEIKAYHRGSKKKPLYLVMVLGEINGKAFGINKYLSVMDLELAIESGEILLQNRKMTKIKEAKELFEIDMMTKDEFDALKEELRPIITGN